MSIVSIEIGIVRGRDTGLHDACPQVSVAVAPEITSRVATTADQASQGYDLGTLRVATASEPIWFSVGEQPDAAAAPRRFLAPWDVFEGVIKQGHRVAVMMAGNL